MDKDLYAGFDLSTQVGLTASSEFAHVLVIRSDLRVVHAAKVDFDQDLGDRYGIHNGVLTNPSEGEVFAPVAMWLEALDLVLERLRADGVDFNRVKAISGAGMQHGTIFWSLEAGTLLKSLSPNNSLVEQLCMSTAASPHGAFSHPYSPNWQDASTQTQCAAFDACLGNEQVLADVTGSSAHHRFSGPQILRFVQKYPEAYRNTSRISLVSSFLCSIFLGTFAPIDIGDVCGMNLWDIQAAKWNEELLALTAGDKNQIKTLEMKLGNVTKDGGVSLGKIFTYFVERYGFSQDCDIAPFTGDNLATILSLPLRPSDAIVSLGTSTTFLMSTSAYRPYNSYHFLNHPTTAGLYMFMLCYKNGSLARERVRDALNASLDLKDNQINPWDAFNDAVTTWPPLGQAHSNDAMHLSLYFPLSEIVPNISAGEWHFTYLPITRTLTMDGEHCEYVNVLAKKPRILPRAIIESQLLSMRLRSCKLVTEQRGPSGDLLPPQPRRIYLVGGGSVNSAIQRLCGEVLGGAEGVYTLDVGGNACSLGAAYKAFWAIERRGETFEQVIGSRWREDDFICKVDNGYRKGVWEKYGEALVGFEMMEQKVLNTVSAKIVSATVASGS